MYLKTEEVNLYYEVQGQGKPLLLIHGAVVDSGLYQEAARLLSPYYQVVTYDRRGNSRSIPVYRPQYSVEAQVRDGLALLEHLGISQVFLAGASAGAIIALELFRSCPEKVKHVFLYEPPLVPLLMEETERQWVSKIEGDVAGGKLNRAVLEFMLSLGETDDRRAERPREAEEREIRNYPNFLKNEFGVFMHYTPEIGYYKEKSDWITVAIGERSGESKYVRAARKFSQMIGCELLHFPGCHNLPGDLPGDFVNGLMGVMTRYGWQAGTGGGALRLVTEEKDESI